MQKMAVNNDKDLDVQIREKNDVLLFAEDLVDYTVSPHRRRYNFEWKPTVFRNHSYNTNVPIIRRTIDFISCSLEADHASLHSKMKAANLFNSNSYEKFDKILVAMYFPEGFNAEYFLPYCVNLSIMAVYFDIEGSCGARDLAKQYMYQFLQKYDVLVGGWSAICKFAETFVNMLRDALNELMPFDSSPVSDDIEHQDQEQEEVNNDESSSSPSDEESLSSGDVRLENGYQRQSAYVKIIQYLRKYADCSSKSEPQIGLCSLGELEATSGMSVDEKLISIISNYKIKTNMLRNKINLIGKSSSE